MVDLDSSPRSYARFSKSVYLNSRSYSSKYLTPAHVEGGRYLRRGVGVGISAAGGDSTGNAGTAAAGAAADADDPAACPGSHTSDDLRLDLA